MKPLGRKVAIQPIKDEEQKSAGGIIIPISAESELHRGVVRFLGTQDIGLKVGDEVLYPSDAGVEVEHDNVKLLILAEGEMTAKQHKKPL